MSRVVNKGITNALPNFKRLKLSDERNIGHNSLLCKQNKNLGFVRSVRIGKLLSKCILICLYVLNLPYILTKVYLLFSYHIYLNSHWFNIFFITSQHGLLNSF